MDDLLTGIRNVQFIHRDKIKPNFYNPNKVSEMNLKLLEQSILANGWTLPIVIRPDFTIIDGFHRWLISGREPLLSKLQGVIPCVIVKHSDEAANIYGTITHNRARGTHLLDPMKHVIQMLLDKGKSVAEIGKELGMKPEEVFRLSDFSRADFLELMVKEQEYSKAEFITKL